MFPVSRTLASLTRVLLPRRGTTSPSQGQSVDIVASSARQTHSHPITLVTLNLDVLRLIFQELKRIDGTRSLRKLASCCRILRGVAAPYIFYGYYVFPEYNPPLQICQHIRHISILKTLNSEAAVWLEHLLDSLPSLSAITFHESYGVTWSILETIFARPCIKSLAFSSSTNFSQIAPYSSDQLPDQQSHITSLVCSRKMWREMSNENLIGGPGDLEAVFAQEAKCLAALVLSVRSAVVQLTLPLETAPLVSMTALDWPNLQDLSLYGRYQNGEQAEALQRLLSSLGELQTISIRAARCEPLERPFILEPNSTPSGSLSRLRALTIAYPNPSDPIFSVDMSDLRLLSLRDWPRYYTHLGYLERYWQEWETPLLSATECLTILERMSDMPHMTSLELVYVAPTAGSDDELLEYVASSFPRLKTLELHRYRENREEHVDHRHVVERLKAAKSLRCLRLNLDFHDDHGPYCNVWTVRDAWFSKLTGKIGWEIVEIVEKHCPLLEVVEVLYHGVPTASWAEFHPCRCADPRFVLMPRDPKRQDSERIPPRWYGRRAPPLPDVTPPPRCARLSLDT